jgi:hypothetical protein
MRDLPNRSRAHRGRWGFGLLILLASLTVSVLVPLIAPGLGAMLIVGGIVAYRKSTDGGVCTIAVASIASGAVIVLTVALITSGLLIVHTGTRTLEGTLPAPTLSEPSTTLSLPTPTSNLITPATVLVSGTEPNEVIAFETNLFRLELTPLGEVKSVIDKVAGVNYVDQRGSGILFPFVSAVHENRSLYPVQMEARGTKLAVKLDSDSEVVITLQVKESPDFLTFEIEDIQGPPVNFLRFIQIPLKLDTIKSIGECGKGVGNNQFGVYLVPLNEQVKIYAGVGRGQGVIAADIQQLSKIKGAKVVVFGSSPGQAPEIVEKLFVSTALHSCNPHHDDPGVPQRPSLTFTALEALWK